jgi:hypothetical protein
VSLGRAARLILAAGLLIIGVLAVLWSWGPLRNVFEEHRDNTVATYVSLAAIFWVVAAFAFVAALLLVRSARRMS